MKSPRNLLLSAVVAMTAVTTSAQITLEFVSTDDVGGGLYNHVYRGVRDIAEQAIATDVHLNSAGYQWQPGQVTVTGPGDWVGYYEGDFYSWYYEGAGDAWGPGGDLLLEPFVITVNSPLLTASRFTWTDDPTRLPAGWDGSLGTIAGSTGDTLAPVPEPHEYALFAGVALLGFAAWRRRRA